MLIQADARRIPLADGSVQCCVTSPPYWGLRSYDLPPSIFGGDPECEHVWEIVERQGQTGGDGTKATINCAHNADGTYAGKTAIKTAAKLESAFCQLCNAWRGCLGLEPTPELYVEHMVEVFREVWRVLRDDGTCWLNLGDSYNSQGGHTQIEQDGRANRVERSKMKGANAPGLKPKDLVGIPWRVAFALQADGWWLRSDAIWHKPNPMPESVTDRPTKSHEYLFLLTKSKRYFYDADAVREEGTGNSHGGASQPSTVLASGGIGKNGITQTGGKLSSRLGTTLGRTGRNRRTVWTISTRPYKGAHFATYPPALVEPCILAGTSAKGACPECGAGWERVVERINESTYAERKAAGKGWAENEAVGARSQQAPSGSGATTYLPPRENRTTGWRPTCDCGTEHPIPQEELDADPSLLDDFEIEPFPPIPCLVLDPFAGSGTTGMVAIQHGREFVGLDLNGEYLHQLATERLSKIQVNLF